MGNLVVILSTHLNDATASLNEFDAESDEIILMETHEMTSYWKHHKKKLVFMLSSMRHFAQSLQEKGYRVHYIRQDNLKYDLSDEASILKQWLGARSFDQIIVTWPSDYRHLEKIKNWSNLLGTPVILKEDNHFLCSTKEFNSWAMGRKKLLMEYFYRKMRVCHNVLMDNDKPEGGQWNFDSDNRKRPNANLLIPKPLHFDADNITQDVIAWVAKHFDHHFGEITPFQYAVTREQACMVLDHFIEERLENFGDYQDAMLDHEPWMFHAHISFYLNYGLITPGECIEKAEQAYKHGRAKINCVEGFIRQVLGWREYVRGIYWLKMPQYKSLNALDAKRPLPDFYWTAKTSMNCLKQCVQEVKQNAYGHHIQRLMVLGNFALLMGISPQEVNNWYMVVFMDALEWVELPNVSGMVLFADGGILGSKPYAAGGAYIHKMSNYCASCKYSVQHKNGPKACPFNYLYWHFLIENREKLSQNARLSMMYRLLDRMSDEKKSSISKDAQQFINSICKIQSDQ